MWHSDYDTQHMRCGAVPYYLYVVIYKCTLSYGTVLWHCTMCNEVCAHACRMCVLLGLSWHCLKWINGIPIAFQAPTISGSKTGCISLPIRIAFQCQHCPERPLMDVEYEAKSSIVSSFPCEATAHCFYGEMTKVECKGTSA